YFFKETNNVLWAILRSITTKNNITLSFVKVKAHSNDQFNNKVDEMAKAATLAPRLTFKTSQFDHINYFSRWKNLNIEDHLRHFITMISRNKGFETWINLYRNTKYRNLEVDWVSTF